MIRCRLAVSVLVAALGGQGCAGPAARTLAPAADIADGAAVTDAANLPDLAQQDAPAVPDVAPADTAVTMDAVADAGEVSQDAAFADSPAPDTPQADVADVALADGTLADVTLPDVTDAATSDGSSCTYIDADQYPSDAGDTTPGICFVGLPAADAYVVDVPSPKNCACAPEPPVALFGADPIPPAKLVVELGAGDEKTGAFKPYADGDWVPITHGPQGGVHVWAAFRVALAGTADAKAKIQTHATSRIGCSLAGTGNMTVAYATPDATLPGTYTNASLAMPGIQVVFPVWGSESSAYCGQWLDLRMQIRDAASGQWGEVQRTVRLYDTDMMLGGGP